MDELTQHIEYLLCRHDCVILPGIGAFLASRRPASIHPQWGIITPPGRDICFNSTIRHNDGLLANSISRRRQTSYENAQNALNRMTSEMLGTLHTDREVNVGRIGTLTLSDADTIEFHPADNALALPCTEALRLPSKQSAQESLEAAAAVSPKRIKSDRNYYIAINKTFARWAAVIVLVCLTALSMQAPVSGPEQVGVTTDYASVVPVKKTAVAPVQKQQAAESVAEAPEKANAEPAAETAPRFYLIVASLRNEAEAQSFIASHPGSGLKMVSGSKKCRVYAAASDNRSELQTRLNSQHIADTYPDAWVWEKK